LIFRGGSTGPATFSQALTTSKVVENSRKREVIPRMRRKGDFITKAHFDEEATLLRVEQVERVSLHY
jgi:hypothetical protein